ncbi:ABC transporter substrate-binding protein [Lederbergia panacisoli]|uniref:ABC transporter substrate-binding protein n=1 Tax=Lederbergia panacisoli TaxID=1255251 RepID=UPI00214C4399|nr:ABC transporter substrate-binding protein [Lederbergia panacisoli]MCR2821121.1 ABC transporter substrate-binding protein [Lederbergia panacisoli]
MKVSLNKLAILLFGVVLMLAACGTSSAPKEEEQNQGGSQQEENQKENENETEEPAQKFKIGVTQIVEHDSLNAAFDGFKKAIEDAGLDVEWDVQNALGEPNNNPTIATNLVNAGVDLIFANSTPSAQSVASETQDIPIVFTSVTDAVGADLVESMEKPGGNVTGTIDNHPDAIPNTMKFIAEELGAKKVGMVFNSGEQNSRAQVDTAKKAAEELGITVVEASVSTSAEVKQATESLLGNVDSIYIITDNTVVSALDSVVDVANTNKLPLMVGEFDSVRNGGLGAYGFEYFDIGYEAGQMAVKILKDGVKPADIPAQVPQNLKLVMNKETAETIGLEIKDEWNAELE